MALNDALCWYQLKIGSYDKQLWEETVEQRILSGLAHVPKKSAKLKLDYIDLDVVRGTSFPKLKPKHGLLFLSRLCLIRVGLLPFYRQWWIRQTSSGIFRILLVLYGLQLINMMIYFTRPVVSGTSDLSSLSEGNSTGGSESGGGDVSAADVSAEEVLLPALMMCLLSLLLSQMVSTHLSGNRSLRRPKNRIRVKRTKRRIGRRISTTGSDSKSSVENLEQMVNLKVEDKLDVPAAKKRREMNKEEDGVAAAAATTTAIATATATAAATTATAAATTAGREDRSRVKVSQRSTSLHFKEPEDVEPCGPSSQQQQTLDIAPPTTRRRAWFFSWPVSLVVPNRGPNEDEGFDSFHGNNSSSSDGENNDAEIRVRRSRNETIAEEDHQGKDLDNADADGNVELELDGNDDVDPGSHSLVIEDKDVNAESDPLNDIIDLQENSANPALLRRRRNMPSIMLKLIPPVDNHVPAYPIAAELASSEIHRIQKCVTIISNQRRSDQLPAGESSYQSSCESDVDCHSSIASPSYKLSEPSTPLDWTGVTTNSEECSYSSETRSESDEPDTNRYQTVGDIWNDELAFMWESQGTTSIIPSSDKVSCTIWEQAEIKKADLTVLDVAAAIIAKVDVMPESTDYLCGGLIMAIIFALLPIVYRINGTVGNAIYELLHPYSYQKLLHCTVVICDILLGASRWDKLIVVTAAVERFAMAGFFLFLLAVAERTFKQRFLYAKLFSHLTSSRRARNSDLPHFRLNKVRNIKTWLSVRSYLKKRGPQRSVDCIVSAAFIITLLLVSFLCMELLKESQYLHQSLYNVEVLCWCLVLGVFLLRFMTLGSKINKKYRNLSVLITEQVEQCLTEFQFS